MENVPFSLSMFFFGPLMQNLGKLKKRFFTNFELVLFFNESVQKSRIWPMNRVLVAASNWIWSEILTSKFWAYMTQIEARIFRKAWFQLIASIGLLGGQKFRARKFDVFRCIKIETANPSWKIRHRERFAFFVSNAIQNLSLTCFNTVLV